MRRWIFLVIALAHAAPLTSCVSIGLEMNCNQRPVAVHEWPSPDGKWKAVENRYTCPGWYSLNIDVIGAQAAKSMAFSDRPVAQKRPPVWPDLKVAWKSGRELWITYPSGQDTTCISTAAGLEVHCIDGAVLR